MLFMSDTLERLQESVNNAIKDRDLRQLYYENSDWEQGPKKRADLWLAQSRLALAQHDLDVFMRDLGKWTVATGM